MSLTVPKFTIKNKFDYSNTAPEKQLNESSWRYLYENTENNPDSPESTNDPNYRKQLPWLTLYKTHKDLLQIKLVTTVAYVEKVTDPVNNPNDTHYEAVYIKGFPLMLQGPDTQFDDKSNISTEDWEYNWPFYKEHVESLSIDLSNNVANWDNFNAGNSKVIVDMKKTERRNLLILDLDHDDFVLKNNGQGQNKFIDPLVKNYNSKERPPYMVVRLDSAIEESSFAYTGNNNIEPGLVVDNTYFNDGTNTSPKLYVFNYVYSGYVISPYDFMSAFTTDYLRGQFTLTNTLFYGYVNKDLNGNTSPNVIQVNSKFFSSTHNIKDGWDNSRKNRHKLIKTPYYYNFFLQIPEVNIEDISGTIINDGSSASQRFKTISYSATNLSPSIGSGINYGIEKLFWCSLTSPRHTIYSGEKNNGKQKAFIGNYLNVNEVDASYNSIDGRIFINPNADYMPERKNVITSGNTTTSTMTPNVNNTKFAFVGGSGTASDPWTGKSQNHEHDSEANISFVANGNGTVYIQAMVDSETNFDYGYVYVNGNHETDDPDSWRASTLHGDEVWYPNSTSYESFTLQANGEVRFRYTKDSSVHDNADELTFYIYWVGETITIPSTISTEFLASGYIEREIREESVKFNQLNNLPTYKGKNEINMVRKTITPYYHPYQYNNEESINTYAFLYPNNETWSDYTTNGTNIQIDTQNIDIDNCQVIELRNLIDFTTNTLINVDISLNSTNNRRAFSLVKKTITFVTGDSIHSTGGTNTIWKNNITLLKNSVKSKYQVSDMRTIDRIQEDAYRISFSSDDIANTQKLIYVMDIASGSYLVDKENINIFATKNDINGGAIDTFLPSNWDDHKELVTFIANVYQIKLNKSNDNGVIRRDDQEFLNLSLDGDDQQISIYSEPHWHLESMFESVKIRNPLFAYFNFYGITSSEFLGGIDWHKGGGINGSGEEQADINLVLRKCLTGINSGNRKRLTDSPYLLLIDYFRFRSEYNDTSKIYFNSNIFYGATNFAFSNVYAKKKINDLYNQTDILFLNKTSGPSNPEWRDNAYKTDGLDITTLSNNELVNNETNIRIFISKTGIELYNATLIGKFGINNRILTSANSNEPSCIELNDGIDISFNGVSVKYDCFNFYKTAYVASQKNLFINDFWKWDERLVKLTIPQESYTGRIPVGYNIVDRSLNNRYNVYNWKATDIPSNLYPGDFIHNPQRAFENQCLINFKIEVSAVSFNVSHILINTWSGNIDINNNINSNAVVGLSSFANTSGNYEIINGSPILRTAGGLSISPSIEENPIYIKFDINGQLNLATDQNVGNTTEEEISKAPSTVPEADGTIIDFGTNIFGIQAELFSPGGWFTHSPSSVYGNMSPTLLNTSRNGIFVPHVRTIDGVTSTPTERYYSTIDFSANALGIDPTNITIPTDIYPGDGGIRKEEQAFPIELLFCYPFNIPDDKKPDKLVSTYTNSDGVITTKKFDNYKGNKRFSNLYALKVSGDNIEENNINFRNRSIFPETILVNCVELPPPKQVNNFNDMLAKDNSFVKLVWKGYNFNYSPGNVRSQFGNVGNIIWKIERFQTQLGLNTTIFEGIITPDDGNNSTGFNLSKYTYKDTAIRIYDKYKYTVSGTYVYNFIRTKTDTNIYTLSMPFGSFTTEELIVCKNNKFTYGRYNTTSTNLKLYRPLLINKDQGQVDENGNKVGGLCLGNIFNGSSRISSSQNIYANTSNQLTKKETYVLLSKQRFRPFR